MHNESQIVCEAFFIICLYRKTHIKPECFYKNGQLHWPFHYVKSRFYRTKSSGFTSTFKSLNKNYASAFIYTTANDLIAIS